MPAKQRYNAQMHRRSSIRLKSFDYNSPTEYFVTICTYERECFFGEIQFGKMRLSQVGTIARQCWMDIPDHFSNIELDEYKVMPNHVHGIIRVLFRVGTRHAVSLHRQFSKPIRGSISTIIGSFKSATTKICHDVGIPEFAWQPRFHDHIIRDQNDLNRIRKYIRDNVENWEMDEENPKVIQLLKNKQSKFEKST